MLQCSHPKDFKCSSFVRKCVHAHLQNLSLLCEKSQCLNRLHCQAYKWVTSLQVLFFFGCSFLWQNLGHADPPSRTRDLNNNKNWQWRISVSTVCQGNYGCTAFAVSLPLVITTVFSPACCSSFDPQYADELFFLPWHCHYSLAVSVILYQRCFLSGFNLISLIFWGKCYSGDHRCCWQLLVIWLTQFCKGQNPHPTPPHPTPQVTATLWLRMGS